MPPPLSHEELRAKVCCVCLNEHGEKAAREVSNGEADIVTANWVPKYNVSNPRMPSGICLPCIFDINRFRDGIEVVHPLLPENYHCENYHPPTRAVDGVFCKCTWCKLGRKNGVEMRKFYHERKGKVKVRRRLCQECYRGVIDGQQHDCDPSDAEKARNLLNNIPEELAAKIAAAYIAEKVKSGEGSSIVLPQCGHGGRPLVVTVGQQAAVEKEAFTHKEIVGIAAEAGVSQKSMKSILGNMRPKLGRKIVEPGLHLGFAPHNNQYRDYFAAKFEEFEGSDGKKIRMPFVHCTDLNGFIEKLEENRGGKRGKKRKIGGDSGKGFLKITLSIYDPEDHERKPAKKARRSYDQGVSGGVKAEETGQSMIMVIAGVPTIPESAVNLEKMYEHCGINQEDYKLTGDLKLLMPSFGLKGCSSLHPCLFCTQMRKKGQWVGPYQLRTFGNIREQFESLPEDPKKRTATATTANTQSVVGPVLVQSVFDEDDKTVLEKVGMPGVHLLLAVNDILAKAEDFFGGRSAMLQILKDGIGIVPHSYQGRDGAFAGPECAKLLDKLDVIQPYLVNGSHEGEVIINLLMRFARVKNEVFANDLGENWEDALEDFSRCLNLAHENNGPIPISPKLHIIATHVMEAVKITGRGLGLDNETAVEAAHGSFLKVWEKYFVRDMASDVYLENFFSAILKFNADNTRHNFAE